MTPVETARAQLVVVRALHPGIYSSHGGGRPVEYARFPASRVGLQQALRSFVDERREARATYGTIGAGRGWFEVVRHGCAVETGASFSLNVSDCLPTVPTGATLGWWLDAIEQAEANLRAAREEEDARWQAERAREEAECRFA